MVKRVALVGARGYVGQELLEILARNSNAFELVYASSRAHKGLTVSEVFPHIESQILFETPAPDALAKKEFDIAVLGLPNGLAAPYVEALDTRKHNATIIDLSGDHRHMSGWTYGLSDVFTDAIKQSRRIANPGCYATAANLSLYSLRDVIAGTPSIFGVSGYSGAGTKPSDKNDPDKLADNILPYGFDGHTHQAEVSTTLGIDVRFMPHVAQFFRGLMVTISVPLKDGLGVSDIHDLLTKTYQGNPTITVQTAYPEIAQITHTPNAIIGGFAIDETTGHLSFVCVLDNLQKGAAAQCFANMQLMT